MTYSHIGVILFSMIKCEITTELLEASKEYPVVTVFGPRQAGKTTLARMTFPDKDYFSLEDPDIRMIADTDPRGFLSGLPDGGILDEIQRLPQLLSYIQGIVDNEKKNGMFILTGRHQPELHQSVSQTLAGRTAVLNLLPFSLPEIKKYKETWGVFELIYKGSYPRLHEEKMKPTRFFNSYMQTYVERDVRALINLKDLKPFQQFITLLAGRVGQVVNYASLSNDIGVSSTTIKNWLNVLVASFVVFELPPFFENIRKRVIKSSKIYFCDSGLVAYLLGIQSSAQVSRDPLRGGLYENFMILEILKSQLNSGQRSELFFYRDTHGNEVDLVIKSGRRLIPIEIKSASTFTSHFLKGIKHFRKVAGDSCTPGYVFYNGSSYNTINETQVLNPIVHKIEGILG